MSDKDYGLLLRRANRHGTEYLVAEVVVRNEEGNIRNTSDSYAWERPKPMNTYALEGLQIDGFITEYGEPSFIGFEPRYRDRYSVDVRDAQRMAKTLTRIYAHAEKAVAREAEDWFMSLCAVLKLSFVVESRNMHQASNYDDNKWDWMTIGEGRNRFRQLISNMVDTAKQLKAAKEELAV